MKYFTREWCWSELSDNVIDKISRDYENYIDTIYSSLPFTLKLIAKKIDFHDGLVFTISFSVSKKILSLSGIFGDLETGYFKLEICYKDVCDFDQMFLFSSGKELEVLRDEIEYLNNSCFVHRFIFSNKSEFKICFRDCHLKIESATSKDYKKSPCSLVVLS